ncbi:MAG TPA: RNA-binding protein [Verrucomicrobiae bacterium]|nr:RNA-binding protein [Verrucomicrobiae bacterium]
MNTKIYVENIAPTTTENELKALFSIYGNVAEVNIVLDRTCQKPWGVGFVTMVTPEGTRAAIHALHGRQIAEHRLTVTEAAPKQERNGLSSQHRKPCQGSTGSTKTLFKGAL